MKLLSRLYILLLILAFACKSDNDVEISKDIELQKQEIESFLESNGIDSAVQVTTGSGQLIYYYPISIPLDPNAETQSSGNVFSIIASLSLLNGTSILPFSVSDTIIYKTQANALFPPGLDQGIRETNMRTGDRYGIIISSGLALGQIEINGLIPPNSPLHFQVELADISTEQEILEDELEAITDYIESEQLNDTSANPLDPVVRFPSNGISYKKIRAGSERTRPTSGNTVGITYELRYLDGSLIQIVTNNSPFQFVVGSTNSEGGFVVIPGLNFAVQQMEIGERALFMIPSNLGYLESAQVVPEFITAQLVEERIIPAYAEQVEPYSVLVFDMILRGINE